MTKRELRQMAKKDIMLALDAMGLFIIGEYSFLNKEDGKLFQQYHDEYTSMLIEVLKNQE